MKTNRGFTLIELLTTLTVIAILTGLLTAGVGAAKDRSAATQCMSNLRQLAIANLAHAADHDGQYVQAQEGKNLTRWHGARESHSSPFDPAKGPLAPYLGEDGRIKVCPTFRDPSKEQTFELGTGGYGYNANYVGGTPRSYTDGSFLAARISQIPSPARVIMFADSAYPNGDTLQEYAYAEPFRAERANGLREELFPSIHFRHHGCANVAWCDGHVTAEPPSRLGGINPHGGDSSKWNIGWFGPETNNGFWKPQETEIR